MQRRIGGGPREHVVVAILVSCDGGSERERFGGHRRLSSPSRGLQRRREDEPDGEVLSSFLKQFYESAVYVPKAVVVPFAVPEASLIEEWLSTKRG